MFRGENKLKVCTFRGRGYPENARNRTGGGGRKINESINEINESINEINESINERKYFLNGPYSQVPNKRGGGGLINREVGKNSEIYGGLK